MWPILYKFMEINNCTCANNRKFQWQKKIHRKTIAMIDVSIISMWKWLTVLRRSKERRRKEIEKATQQTNVLNFPSLKSNLIFSVILTQKCQAIWNERRNQILQQIIIADMSTVLNNKELDVEPIAINSLKYFYKSAHATTFRLI